MKNIYRFVVVFSLAAALGSTPAIAAPSRDAGSGPERPGIVRIVEKLIKKIFRLTPTEAITVPIPNPDNRG